MHDNTQNFTNHLAVRKWLENISERHITSYGQKRCENGHLRSKVSVLVQKLETALIQAIGL
jgi:hypothetical protein